MKRGRPRQFDEAVVLERAMEFFWAHGYRGAGLTELLAHLSLGRQSFYDAFGSKRGIYLRAIGHYRSTQLTQVLALLERPGSSLGNVRAAVGCFEKLARHETRRGCFVANALLELDSNDDELRHFLEETLLMLEKGYHKALKEAKQKGELDAGKNPRALARALTNASIGLAVTGRLGQSPSMVSDIYAGTLSMLK
jgi:TetR/AcrR family transcriptional regulator, transcriptional repressor for nem operon